MKVRLSQSEMESLAHGAIQSAKRLGMPLKKKKKVNAKRLNSR